MAQDAKVFSHEKWQELIQETVAQIHELSTVKGGEYAGDTDRLANFRRNAEAIGVPMSTVWRVYAGKHWDSIAQWVKDIQDDRDRPRSESMLGRFDDLIVYAILGKAIYIELTQPDEEPQVATPVAYTLSEIDKWKSWVASWTLKPGWEQIRKDGDSDFARIPIYPVSLRDEEYLAIFAIKFSNDRIWDCVNGWRTK